MSKEYKLEELLYMLLGGIDVHCESYHDREVEKNLENYNIALDWIIRQLRDCASWKGDYRASANGCGTKAVDILLENDVSC